MTNITKSVIVGSLLSLFIIAGVVLFVSSDAFRSVKFSTNAKIAKVKQIVDRNDSANLAIPNGDVEYEQDLINDANANYEICMKEQPAYVRMAYPSIANDEAAIAEFVEQQCESLKIMLPGEVEGW